MKTKTFQLTEIEVQMIKNALEYTANKMLDNYRQAVELEKNDQHRRETTANEYMLERYKRYSDLAQDLDKKTKL